LWNTALRAGRRATASAEQLAGPCPDEHEGRNRVNHAAHDPHQDAGELLVLEGGQRRPEVSMLFWHYATGQALTGLALVQFFPSVAG
jgi:hypothetical protein